MKKIFLLLVFISKIAFAQVPDLVKKIRTSPPTTPINSVEFGGGQYTSGTATLNGFVYFFGKSCKTCNYSLYKTDGTVGGTQEVISFPKSDDRIIQLIASNSKVYIKVGWNIYSTDGTAAGTVELATDITRFDVDWVISNNYLYYVSTINGQYNLMKSDGTLAGTSTVYSFGSVSAANLFDFNGTLLFLVNGISLWKSDGTNGGTSNVAGTNGFQLPVNVNGIVYFTVGTQLWKTQGTVATTGFIVNLSNPIGNLVNLNGTLYFSNGTELWKSDGTAIGTVSVKNVGSGLYNLKVSNNIIYFFGNDGTTGYELWRSDGTATGTNLVKDIFPGTSTGLISLDGYAIPTNNSIFYFFANNGSTGTEIWRTDGTNAGTYIVKDLYPGSLSSFLFSNTKFIGVVNSMLIFNANDGITGFQLYKSDGTAAGTGLLKTIAPNISTSFNYPIYIPKIAQLGTNLIVVPKDNSDSTALWKTDGMEANTLKIKSIAVDDYFTSDFVKLNTKLYFAANETSTGNELWQTDGTSAGTNRFLDIYSGPSGSLPTNFYTFNGLFYFRAYSSIATIDEVWRSDGTQAGTFKLINYAPAKYIEYNGNLYFKNSKANLVRTDGTVANTVTVTNISPSSSNGIGQEMAVANNFIFFLNNPTNTSTGIELWKSDGTVGGTSMVKDINVGVGNASPQNLVELNNNLYFLAFDGVNYGLWKSDGTSVGTVLIKSLDTKINITYNFSLTKANNLLYFTFNDGVNGYELWKSDGTLAGTSMVKNINPNGSSSPSNFTSINGKLYFSADNGVNGTEIWASDGTSLGTNMLYDINSGLSSSFPVNITFFNNYIYFMAFSSTQGYELWRFDPDVLESISSNNWAISPTWNTGVAPISTNTAKINPTHTVSVPNAGNQVKTIQMNGGSINLNGGTIQINN